MKSIVVMFSVGAGANLKNCPHPTICTPNMMHNATTTAVVDRKDQMVCPFPVFVFSRPKDIAWRAVPAHIGMATKRPYCCALLRDAWPDRRVVAGPNLVHTQPILLHQGVLSLSLYKPHSRELLQSTTACFAQEAADNPGESRVVYSEGDTPLPPP